MAKLEFVVLYFVAIAFLDGGKLPSYIVPCKSLDPNLNECARKHGQEALIEIVKGDPKYKIPNLTPLSIPEINFRSGELIVDLTNVKISGFDETQIKDVKFDLEKRHVSIVVGIERANLLSDYKIDGRVLVLPIKGQGAANITFVGGEYNYVFDFDFKQKNGENYILVTKNDLTYTTRRAHFYFENLFGSNKQLGDYMNQFLNDNWKEVQRDIGPAITETINSIITNIITTIFIKVPYDGIFI